MPNRNSQAMGRIDRQREPASGAVDPPKGHQLIDKSPQSREGDGGGHGRHRCDEAGRQRPPGLNLAMARLAPRPTGLPRRFTQIRSHKEMDIRVMPQAE
jgi:hypothetical protein